MQSEFIRKAKEADNIYSFFFTKPKQLVYDPGDFTELSFDYPDGGGGRRWFTIASAPHEKELQITMKFPSEPSEYKQQLNKLKAGDGIVFSPALGSFNLPKDVSEKLVFIAGGIGITPFRSIMSHLQDSDESRDIALYYISKPEERVFTDLLEEYSVSYKGSGFDPTNLDLRGRTVFLSGPEPLIKKYYKSLTSKGVQKSRIKLDYFPGYTDI